MVCFGYLRVSTEKQSVDNMREEIIKLSKEKGYDHVVFISETISGRKDWKKRMLGKEFEKMHKDDCIIMSEYSRIGRDFLNSLSFISACREKGIKLFSVIGDIPAENDANSNLMMSLTAWKSQQERELIAYRTKIGIASAKARGSILGRKKEMILDKDPANVERIREDIKRGIKYRMIAKTYNCTTVTLRKFINKHNLKSN
jgi:DNA invertase Pin-like site-specific DNA recombinase